MVSCPICEKPVRETNINRHIDSECRDFVDDGKDAAPAATQGGGGKAGKAQGFFTPAGKRTGSFNAETWSAPATNGSGGSLKPPPPPSTAPTSTPAPLPTSTPAPAPAPVHGAKRAAGEYDGASTSGDERTETSRRSTKKQKTAHQPLAERMRPRTLSDVAGQDLVGPHGVLRTLIESNQVPSMILWGGSGTGKTTIARLVASHSSARFVEINSTSTGVAECKRLFGEARGELGLTGRRTVVFCDEIHRFSKSQQDVFLGPVERGDIVLVGATTENPSFKVINALLSRCRVFTLQSLREEDVFQILKRAILTEVPEVGSVEDGDDNGRIGRRENGSQETINGEASNEAPSPNAHDSTQHPPYHLLTDDDFALLHYLSAFADGDARTGLNLLELALSLCRQPGTTTASIKSSLTKTLVYDRAGDQHYDTISAFHKSVRGSDPDATLYYLARMLQSGEDPLYVARRMVVIASEDVGLADNSLLGLATATYTAAEKVGMPECRINLAHCAVALSLAPKSIRAYRGLKAASVALSEPGVAGLPIPVHLRNAPTRLMREMGYGREYKYNPDFVGGRVVQEYLPEKLEGRKFLGAGDLGEKVDPEIAELDMQVELAEESEREVRDGGGVGADEDVLLGPDGD